MADAITTVNSVKTTKFIVNKYDEIDGGRVSQETPRGRFCFRDTNGRYTLPRTVAEAEKAVYPVDWAKPLNPPPYYLGAGLNGALPNAFDDGSLGAQESTFKMDPDQAFGSWPVGIVTYDIPPYFFDVSIVSGNKCLVYDEGTFTYGSGNYVGVISDYTPGDKLVVSYDTGYEGMLTHTVSGNTTVVATVQFTEVFGANTITVKVKGTSAL